MKRMDEIARGLLETLWLADPVRSSEMGVTKFDGRLPSADPDEREEISKRLSQYAAELKALLSGSTLSPDERLDAEVAAANIGVQIAKEQSLPDWKNNPDWYLSNVNAGFHVLVSREWAPAEERLEDIKSRLKEVPGFIERASKNLVPAEVPSDWIDIALGSVKGHRRLVEGSVLPFARSVEGERDAFTKLCEKSLAAVDAFGKYLAEIRPSAKGQFASGRRHFERMLQSVHMVDMDADQLKEFGELKVAEYEDALVRAAKSIDPNKHWTELITEFKKDHPAPENLLDSYLNEGRLAEEFVRTKDLITIPEGQSWTVLPVPEFSRATHPLGYMRTSPPFSDGMDSALYITPIDLTASPERQEQHLQDNCYAFQRTIAFHELIPGHHLQSCLSKIGISDLRKQFRSTVFIEGWGLYTELLMAEQGYLSEPATNLINLKNALWRAVRVVIDVGLHVGGMTLEEATNLLMEKVRMEHHMASGEAKRYTMSPTYQSSYLLGKEQIAKLRSDYEAKLGPAYTLKGFHDKLTSYGSIPVALVRREMLAGR
jgi:uncharacterized protein (DUF885 family)